MKPDGGPAFPCPPGFDNFQGMSLLDYFAAAALQGMLARPTFFNDYVHSVGVSEEEAAAHYAYSLARAMLAEKSKP